MLFHSYVFLFGFLPIAWAVFLLFKRRGLGRAAAIWLLACSLGFYGWWNPKFLVLILASIGGNFVVGLGLGACPERWRKPLLWAGLAFNLGILGYFKYAGFLLEVFDQLTGASHAPLAILLPLAISFYTFQQISYVVDTYRSRQPVGDFVNYCLFVVFFPHLIAGPITHHAKIIPQFAGFYDRRFNTIDYAVGLSLFTVGLSKKVLLADPIGAHFAAAYPLIAAGVSLSLVESWLVMTACALQIYFDYSGYADMAAGIGLLFGVRMPLNFFSPYKATSPIDFWRRWNMTLMKFLRDYIYIPIGGSRYGERRKYFASFVTMVVCGIWHGAGWNYIVWGALVATIIMVNNLWLKYLGAPTFGPDWARRVGGRALAFVAYVVPLAIFMFPLLSQGWSVVSSMFAGDVLLPASFQNRLGPVAGWLAAAGVGFARLPAYGGSDMLLALGVGLVVLYLCPNSEQLFGRYHPTTHDLPAAATRPSPAWLRWRLKPIYAVPVALAVALSLGFMHQVSEFFYFQF